LNAIDIDTLAPGAAFTVTRPDFEPPLNEPYEPAESTTESPAFADENTLANDDGDAAKSAACAAEPVPRTAAPDTARTTASRSAGRPTAPRDLREASCVLTISPSVLNVAIPSGRMAAFDQGRSLFNVFRAGLTEPVTARYFKIPSVERGMSDDMSGRPSLSTRQT
jgi:hypothetical protein